MTGKDPADRAIAAAERALGQSHWQRARDLAQPHENHPSHGYRATLVLANVSFQTGDFDAAVAYFQSLLDRTPTHDGIRQALSMALNNRGSQALSDGQPDSALSSYRRAVAVWKGNALAWFNLAACLEKRKTLESAASAYEQCVAVSPDWHEARIQWAACERVRGNADTARRVLAGLDAQNKPLTAELGSRAIGEWVRLGQSLQNSPGNWNLSLPDPASGKEPLRLAAACLEAGLWHSAAEMCGDIEAGNPSGAVRLRAALLGRLALPAIAARSAEIDESRRSFARGIEHLAEHWPAHGLREKGVTLEDLAHSHLQLAYQGRDDLELARALGRWYAAAARAVAGTDIEPGGVRAKSSQRHLVLVSARWNRGTVSEYFGSWIGALAGSGWKTTMVQVGAALDDRGAQLARTASGFQHFGGDLDTVAAGLAELAPDVLLYPEVGLDPRTHVLAALRLAPLQAAAWGHPVTTGLETIDYFFSCGEMEPQDGARHYTEKLVLLPGIGTRYARPAKESPLARSEAGLPDHRALLAAPHSARKMGPEFDELLVAICRAEPRAAIVLFQDTIPAITGLLKTRLERAFSAAGLDAADFVVWLPHVGFRRFRAILSTCDVMLDTPAFSGGNVTLDALAQGLPVVTCGGNTMRSRQTAAMLVQSGLGEFVASGRDAYVQKVLETVQRQGGERRLRELILDRTDALFNDSRALETLVEAFDRIWSERSAERT